MEKDKTKNRANVYRRDLRDRPTLERNCKTICPNRGYTRDCTDP